MLNCLRRRFEAFVEVLVWTLVFVLPFFAVAAVVHNQLVAAVLLMDAELVVLWWLPHLD